MKQLILVIMALTCMTSASFASLVYDNGSPNQSYFLEMTASIPADDFKLQTTTSITGITFWTYELASTSYSGSIYYGIYSNYKEYDFIDIPNYGSPGVEGFLPATNLSRTLIGSTTIGGTVYNAYAYNFDIQPFTAQAGVTYWLGLHNGPVAPQSTTTGSGFEWASSSGSSAAWYDILDLNGAGDYWCEGGYSPLAFQLTSGASDPPAPVPEPSTFLLLGAGLAGVGIVGLLKRRQKTK